MRKTVRSNRRSASPARKPWVLAATSTLVGLALAFTAINTRAQTAPEEYRTLALQWARDAARAAVPAGTSLRLEVSVGAMDSRLRLAACGNVEPYMPVGYRAWGQSRVGLRCVDGMSRWNVTMPLSVKAFGPAWVVKGQIPANGTLTQNDVVQAEVDWAQESQPVLADASQWLGQSATRVLGTGQALRQGMVRAAQVFQAGSPVRVVAQGKGFQISGEAQALSAGVVGQVARVKLDNGRIASGVVLDARTVKIEI